MKRIVVVVTLICLVACDKKNSEINERKNVSGIVGKWKLTESLADPGDGSGVWRPANPDNPVYLEFKGDSSLVFTPSDPYDSDHYSILNDSSMTFFRDTMQFRYQYKLSENKLTLLPPCIEACGLKYTAVE